MQPGENLEYFIFCGRDSLPLCMHKLNHISHKWALLSQQHALRKMGLLDLLL